MNADFLGDYIDANQARFTALSDAIWDTPETPLAANPLQRAAGRCAGAGRLRRDARRRQY